MHQNPSTVGAEQPSGSVVDAVLMTGGSARVTTGRSVVVGIAARQDWEGDSFAPNGKPYYDWENTPVSDAHRVELHQMDVAAHDLCKRFLSAQLEHRDLQLGVAAIMEYLQDLTSLLIGVTGRREAKGND